MVEVVLEGMAKNIDEGTIGAWLVEEGDPVNEGDELVEITTESGTFTITSPAAGILAEVYYDEGEVVARGEVLCQVDDDASADEDEDNEDEE